MFFYGALLPTCDHRSPIQWGSSRVSPCWGNGPERYTTMADIVLTAGVRSNLLQLQKTSDLITATQTKLATGKRVNTALDNPINFFTAQGLSNRASDLSNLLDSMSTAFNTIQAANNGITSITKLVQSAQALVSQAQQTSDTTIRAEPCHPVRRDPDPDRPARGRLGLQRHQPARQHHQHRPHGHAERNRHLERHGRRRSTSAPPATRHQQRHQQLGRHRRHHRGLRPT